MLITLSGPWELGGEPGPDDWEIGEILEIPYTHPGWKLSPLEGLLWGPEFRMACRVVSY